MNALFPLATTNANAGMFADPSSAGLVQGQDMSDPVTVFRLRGGVISTAETLPMWGGLPLYQQVPTGPSNTAPNRSLGPVVGRSTTVTGGSKPIMAWSVFQQNYSWVNAPGSTAPQGAPGQSCNYYPIGSLARIVVACDPILIDLQGGLTNAGASLAWDFTNGQLIPYTGTIAVSSGTYNNTTGVATVTLASAAGISAGDAFQLSSLTGTGAFASLNGTWTATQVAGAVVTFQAPAGLGATAITGGSFADGSQLSGLPTQFNVLDVFASNCVTVGYNATTGATNWLFGTAAAIIQI